MKSAPTDALKERIKGFLQDHKATIKEIADKSSNVFEAYCFVLFTRHYENEGYDLRLKNLTSDGLFKFRFSTNGNPWNFSYVAVLDGAEQTIFEVRHNQKVVGHWLKVYKDADPGSFALDVAVLKPGIFDVPKKTTGKQHRVYALTGELITFGEAKKLVAYPMLLASFFGIVHELKPEFVQSDTSQLSPEFRQHSHPYPALFTSDHLTKGTENVLKSFEDRQLKILVVENVNNDHEEDLLKRLKGVREDVPLSEAVASVLDTLTQ